MAAPLDGAGERILVIEDDSQELKVLIRLLDRAGYRCSAAADAGEARRLLAGEQFDLLLADVNLPGESGLQFVQHVLGEFPQTAAVMVTGMDDPALANRAIEIGTYGYIMKPFTANELLIGVKNALSRRRLEVENNAQRETLEQIVLARTAALERSAKRLKLSREETVRRLSRAVEYRDEETGGHTERMSAYCGMLAGKLGLDVESIRIASPMHDVGKVALPDHILLRPGALTAEERQEMERHTWIGHQILSGSGSALLELGATIALTHHEKWDGTGYPRRLAGNAIPLEGQVAAVADVFDALTSDRPYRQAFPIGQAVEIMRGERGGQFDPRLVDLFLENVDEVTELRERYTPAPAAAPQGAPSRA
jgi:putative two-component system response regulator